MADHSELIEKITRDRIEVSVYYKDACFALDCATWCDRAANLDYIGGTYGTTQRPSPFICLVYVLLKLHPEPEIVEEYLAQTEDFKYLVAAACLYVRLVYDSVKIYQTLEPFLNNDYRKLRLRKQDGQAVLTYMDEFVDSLLTEKTVFGIALPNLQPRVTLEDQELLEPRVSALASELDSE